MTKQIIFISVKLIYTNNIYIYKFKQLSTDTFSLNPCFFKTKQKNHA